MSVCLASMIRRPVEMVHDDGFQSADRWFSPQITRPGPAITVSGFLSADSLSLDKRRIIGYHYSLRAGVQASRDIVSQCSCSLHPTSVIPPLQCRSLLPLFRRTGSQPGAILAPPMSVLKLGATDFGVARKPAPYFRGTLQGARQFTSEEGGHSAAALQK